MKHIFAPVFLVAAIGCFVLSTSLAVKRTPALTQTNSAPSSPSSERTLFREEPTPIRPGVMTAKQRAHSKLFRGYAGEVTRGKKLSQLVAERGDVRLVRYAGTPILPRSPNGNDFLQKLACEADAVVVGEVKSKFSQISEEGAFLFTDYDLSVQEVLKNASRAPIPPAAEVTVTRTGGAAKLNGHTISTVDLAQKPLAVGGRYLLFLRLIPATGAYSSLGGTYYDDSFELRSGDITQVSDLPLPFGPNRAAGEVTFLTQVRSAIGGCGN